MVFKFSALKKMTLTRLELMPEITDELFESVLRNKHITHLTLGSTKPLKSVNIHDFLLKCHIISW